MRTGWSKSILVIVWLLVTILIRVPSMDTGAWESYALPMEGGWFTECVDCPRFFPEPGDMLVLDDQGQPHFAYGGDHLYYATLIDEEWQSEIVDPTSGVGTGAAIALDPSSRPHIVYYDILNTAVKYAYWDGQVWHRQTVDSIGDVGSYCSLALDDSGRPHISYVDQSHQALELASWR